MNLDWLAWDNPVSFWWVFLALTTGINIIVWLWTLSFLRKSFTGENYLIKQRLLVTTLSGLYVFGCGFRSLLPRADVQRITLFDGWLSSVFVGRSVATVAELAFVTQWALLIYMCSNLSKDSLTKKIALAIVPIITIAEICSWYAVITTNYFGNMIEESLWAFTYVLIGLALFKMRPYFTGALKSAVTLSVIGCVLYVYFMTTVDVPMYFNRWQMDLSQQKTFIGLWEGIKDLNTNWTVTHSINDWREEIPWMSLYFSLAVWVSLALCYVPISRPRLDKYLANKTK